MKSMEKLDLLRAAGIDERQAEAIVRVQEESEYVTRDYLDVRLAQTESKLDARISQVEASIHKAVTDLTWRLLGVVALAIVLVGLIDKFVRP